MSIVPGADVRHPNYGPGRVIQVLGQQAVVDFFGDQLTVDARALEIENAPDPVPVAEARSGIDRVLFRRAYEAVNLGVVPPHPDQLLALSIGGDLIAKRTGDWLDAARETGLCKVIFGDYGLGKSHHLKMIEACALRHGWVVSFLELDPKQVDPAKPHLVYRALMAALRFPTRGDGSRIGGFFGLVGEVQAILAEDRAREALPRFRVVRSCDDCASRPSLTLRNSTTGKAWTGCLDRSVSIRPSGAWQPAWGCA